MLVSLSFLQDLPPYLAHLNAKIKDSSGMTYFLKLFWEYIEHVACYGLFPIRNSHGWCPVAFPVFSLLRKNNFWWEKEREEQHLGRRVVRNGANDERRKIWKIDSSRVWSSAFGECNPHKWKVQDVVTVTDLHSLAPDVKGNCGLKCGKSLYGREKSYAFLYLLRKELSICLSPGHATLLSYSLCSILNSFFKMLHLNHSYFWDFKGS